jgi:hypothetical protein
MSLQSVLVHVSFQELMDSLKLKQAVMMGTSGVAVAMLQSCAEDAIAWATAAA